MQVHTATIAPHEVVNMQCLNLSSHNMFMTLGKRLQAKMKEQNVSAKAVADACGITPGAVSNWFSTSRISKHNLAIACRLLGVDMAAMLAGEDAPRKTTEPAGYSVQALALAWLLDQIPDRLAKTRANTAATKAVLDVIQESAALPTHTPAPRVSPEKPHA